MKYSSPHVLLPDFGSDFIYLHYFHCSLMNFRSICPYHRECSKKYNGSAVGEKKVPRKLWRQKERLKNSWLKYWNPLALIYIPDYLNCTTLFLFLFCFFLFVKVKTTVLKICLALYVHNISDLFFLWFFFSFKDWTKLYKPDLLFQLHVNFFSYFGLRGGLRRNLLILMETFVGSLNTTSCQSHAHYQMHNSSHCNIILSLGWQMSLMVEKSKANLAKEAEENHCGNLQHLNTKRLWDCFPQELFLLNRWSTKSYTATGTNRTKMCTKILALSSMPHRQLETTGLLVLWRRGMGLARPLEAPSQNTCQGA